MNKKVRFNQTVMGEFLANHDLVYEAPAKIWDKGIPMANSLLSTVIWGEDRINVSLNRLDVWEMRHYIPDKDKFKWKYFEKLVAEDKYSVPEGVVQTANDFGPTAQLLPIGRFEVWTKGKKRTDYNMRLSLYDAITTGRFSTEYGDIKWKCHVSAKHPIIIFQYQVFGNEEVTIKLRFCSDLGEYSEEYNELVLKNPTRLGPKLIRGYKGFAPEMAQVLKDWGYPDSYKGIKEGISYYTQEIPENGNYSVAWAELKSDGNGGTLVLSITNDSKNGKAENEAIMNVKEYLNEGKLALEEVEHKKWWHNFYPKSFYSINDTKLEALYWINWYKLGCQTRIDGVAPNMNGAWAPDDGSLVTLGASYIWNTQQQVNLFGTLTANRIELMKTTFDLLKDNRHKMREFANTFFEVDGEFLPHITDYQLNCPNYSANHFELLCGPWMVQMMWNQYLYTKDEDFLRNTVYPMMKMQCRVPMSLLEKWDDDKLHLPCTMSAEYPAIIMGKRSQKKYDNFWGPDATCDIAQLLFMCNTLIKIVKILNISDDDEKEWLYVRDNLAPFTYDECGGLMVRKDLAYTSSHRHLTHLFPITQLYQITNETQTGKDIINNCLYVLKAIGTGEWMGWTFSEAAKIAILANNPSLAYQMIHEYSDKFVNEGTFDCDASSNNQAFIIHQDGMCLTVESDGMFNEALQYFAVRSYNDVIYIMDVLPRSWRDISIYNFRAEGAFLISARREAGVTDFISIYSEKGGKVKLKSCYGTEVDIYNGDFLIPYDIQKDKVIFDTKEGEEYIIVERGHKVDDYMIKPVKPTLHEINAYGVKINGRY